MHLGQSTRVSSLKLAGVISPARLTPPPRCQWFIDQCCFTDWWQGYTVNSQNESSNLLKKLQGTGSCSPFITLRRRYYPQQKQTPNGTAQLVDIPRCVWRAPRLTRWERRQSSQVAGQKSNSSASTTPLAAKLITGPLITHKLDRATRRSQ